MKKSSFPSSFKNADENGYRLHEATMYDIEAIVDLVNRAFEVERFFKNGGRTDVEQIGDMMSEGEFLLLSDSKELIASIYIKNNGERAYIGLLSVDPSRQKSGLGRRMMAEAEQYARAAGCRFADIRTVNLRTELPPLYRKLGYSESGSEDLPAEAARNFTQPAHFVRMSKAL
jgi:GNAT superfamily N-acetyltransferase